MKTASFKKTKKTASGYCLEGVAIATSIADQDVAIICKDLTAVRKVFSGLGKIIEDEKKILPVCFFKTEDCQ